MAQSNTGKYVLIGGGAIALLLLARGARANQAVDNFDYSISSVKFSPVKSLADVLKLKMKVVLDIFNPSQTQLGFKSFVGKLGLAGKPIGNFSLVKPVTIAPQGNTSLEVPVTLSISQVASQLLSLLTGSGAKELNVSGLLSIGQLEVEVNENVPLVADSTATATATPSVATTTLKTTATAKAPLTVVKPATSPTAKPVVKQQVTLKPAIQQLKPTLKPILALKEKLIANKMALTGKKPVFNQLPIKPKVTPTGKLPIPKITPLRPAFMPQKPVYNSGAAIRPAAPALKPSFSLNRLVK